MLFWLFVIILIVSLVFVELLWDYDILQVLSGATAVIVGIAVSISLSIIGCNHLCLDATIAKYQAQYESLTYQYENNFYDNDNDIGKYELVQQIEKWNTSLAYHKAAQRDFWLGIYYPNIYDDLEFISLESGVNNE
jgi:hypothetical protein